MGHIPTDLAHAPAPGSRRGARLVGEVALTVAAVLGVVVMAGAFVGSRAGIRPVVVLSGSMEPTIPAGSMVLARRIDAADIAVGDVVAVRQPDGSRVTHRVKAVEHTGAVATLTLQGDANEDPDPVPVTARTAERVVWHSAGVGRAISWLATPGGGFILGSVLTALVLCLLRADAGAGKRLPRRSRRAPIARARAT